MGNRARMASTSLSESIEPSFSRSIVESFSRDGKAKSATAEWNLSNESPAFPKCDSMKLPENENHFYACPVQMSTVAYNLYISLSIPVLRQRIREKLPFRW